MSNVYIVTSQYGYDDYRIEWVFATEELANNYINSLDSYDKVHHDVESRELQRKLPHASS